MVVFYVVNKCTWLYQYCRGSTVVDRLMVLFMNYPLAFKKLLPSIQPKSLAAGTIAAVSVWAVVYFKGKNGKKFRQGEEYGSARWGNEKDIAPFIDPVFENNILLTQTERLTMNSRPKKPKYARNKNIIVIGGSGSGKTRFYVKPQLMQMPDNVSFVVTDPKGTIIVECGKMLARGTPKKDKNGKILRDKNGRVVMAPYKIKVLNTINFPRVCIIIHFITFVLKRYSETGKYNHGKYQGRGRKIFRGFLDESGTSAVLCFDWLYLL